MPLMQDSVKTELFLQTPSAGHQATATLICFDCTVLGSVNLLSAFGVSAVAVRCEQTAAKKENSTPETERKLKSMRGHGDASARHQSSD